MNKRIKIIGFMAALLTMVVMVILARWGYVDPAPTVTNYNDMKSFWNFSFIEMFGGTFLMWPIVWIAIYKISGKLKTTKNTQGN